MHNQNKIDTSNYGSLSGLKPAIDNLMIKTLYGPPIKCSLFPQFDLDAEKLHFCKYRYVRDPAR